MEEIKNKILNMCSRVSYKMVIKKLFMVTLLGFILIGIFFSAIIAEEIFHSVHMKGAEQICVTTNLKINDSVQSGYLIAYTKFNFSEYDGVEEYNSLRETSEKIVGIGRSIITILIAWAIGFWTGKGMK
jgi:hypothetical protein